ncbi:hypothetical protein D3C72_2014500 [compost metagenome]
MLATVVAEQLSQLFLVIGDAVALHQRDEVLRRVLRQRRAAEIRILRHIAVMTGVHIGEVAAPATGNADLLRQLGGVIQQQHAAAALTGGGSTHHAGGAGADHNYVEMHKANL